MKSSPPPQLGLGQRRGVDLLRPFLAHLRQQHGQALPGGGVGRVVDETEQRNEVADVRLLEEADAARDLVGDFQPGQLELEIEGLEVGAIEDGDVAQGLALVPQAAHALDHELGLLAGVHRLDEERFLTVAPRRFQHFLEMAPLRLGQQHPVGEFQDLRGRAVIGLDAVDHRAGVALREGEDVFEIRPAPGVDALGVVPHRHDPVMAPDRVHDLGLEAVGVLVLVDQDVRETMGEISRGLGRAAQELQPEFQQIVVIEHVLRPLFLRVAPGEIAEALRLPLVLGKEPGDRLSQGRLHVPGQRDQIVERTGFGVGLVLEEALVRALRSPSRRMPLRTRPRRGW